MRVREPGLFWRENMIAVIILLRDLATQRMSWSDGSYRLEVLSFCDRERPEPPSIKIAVLTFLVKKYIEAFWGVNFFLRKA